MISGVHPYERFERKSPKIPSRATAAINFEIDICTGKCYRILTLEGAI